MVPKCLETIRHQIFTGAELSGHFGTSAEIPRDTAAPSVKNTYYGLLFRQNRPTISTICRDLPILQLVRCCWCGPAGEIPTTLPVSNSSQPSYGRRTADAPAHECRLLQLPIVQVYRTHRQ